jgi:hypothetical protein
MGLSSPRPRGDGNLRAALTAGTAGEDQVRRMVSRIPPSAPAGGAILGLTRCLGDGAIEGTASQLMPSAWTIVPLLGTAPPAITQADNGSGQRELSVAEAGWYTARADVRWSMPTSCDGIRVHVRAPQPDDGFTTPAILEVPTRYGFRNDGWHSPSIWGAVATVSTGPLYLDPAGDGRILLEVMAEGSVTAASLTDPGNAANPPFTQLLIARLT